MEKTYQLIVIIANGEEKTVDVATSEEAFNNTTVLEFKKKLVENLPGNTDLSDGLVYAGRLMDNGRKLSDYGIKNISTILLCRRLCGGGYRRNSMDAPQLAM